MVGWAKRGRKRSTVETCQDDGCKCDCHQQPSEELDQIIRSAVTVLFSFFVLFLAMYWLIYYSPMRPREPKPHHPETFVCDGISPTGEPINCHQE